MILPTEPDITPTYLFNPSKDDFIDQIATENGPQKLILPSRTMIEFPKYIADHIAKHLARKLALEEPGTNPGFDTKYEKWLQKIYTNLDATEST